MTKIRATYRVQLSGSFTFDDLAGIAGYLGELGISHVYCSPYLTSTPGSEHGYDVVDPHRLDPELGGEAGFARLSEALARAGLGHIVDIVPNHMAIAGRANRWWWDVLKKGQQSRYAGYFDIDWDPPEAKLRRSILMPILGDHYGRELEAGRLRIVSEGDEIVLRYFEHVLPIDPETLPQGIDLRGLNSDIEAVHDLLENQHYRVAYWRTAGRELDYRRFFDISTMVGLRQEDETVFQDTHRLIFQMARDDLVDGLRIDHVDGLRDPGAYLEAVRAAIGDRYLVVEKVLEPDEELPSWPVDGTTGYDFLDRVNRLFVDASSKRALTALYRDLTDEPVDLAEIARSKKLGVMRGILGSEVERVTATFVEVCEREPRYRDFTRHDLREALRETIAAFPVYRTYLTPGGKATDGDIKNVEHAIALAAERRPDLDEDLFEFLRDVLLLRTGGDAGDDLALRFQQTTGAVMAKAVEDTLFYNFNRLMSLNEVGSTPANYGIEMDDFNDFCTRRAASWPLSMSSTSTHDTKRSEDVRARISLLSEIPMRWAEAVARWTKLNERHRRHGFPDRNIEYLMYQTLVGAYPLELSRALAFAEKASKEAKAHTSWVDPLPEYDEALGDFVTAICSDPAFLSDLDSFVQPLIDPGRVNSLAQTLIRLTAPGIPDTYQGTELWDLSLVDPDNRRPIDYAGRTELLRSLADLTAEEIWARRETGAPKLFVIQKALAVKASEPEAFDARSSYEAIRATGAHSDRVVGFVRGGRVVTVVPRLALSRGPEWADTRVVLPSGTWDDVLSGETYGHNAVSLQDLFAHFPVSLLRRRSAR